MARGLRFLGPLAVVGLIVLSASTASGSPSMVAIGATPRVPSNAKALGAVSASTTVSGELVLKPRDNAALERFISEVTDKSSPLFHQYLAPGAFASRFGPTQATIDDVRSQLQTDGLHVNSVSTDGLFMRFSGTATRVESAFHTGLSSYRLADGTMGRATTSAPALPSTVSGSVAAVLGLTDLVREQPGALRAPASAKRTRRARTASFSHPAGSPKACTDASNTATALGGLTADQIANAYGAFGLYGAGDFGAGQRIAIYELEPFLRSDVKAYDTCFFGATAAVSMLSRLHVVPVDGGQPVGTGSGEAILDVEDISALAPGASIDVYEGRSPGTNGVDYDPVDPYVQIVDNDRDQVVSTSWGLCEQAIQKGQPGLQQAENFLFEQAAAQGQSVFGAAGDNGSDDCNTDETGKPVAGQNPVSVDDPASQPYVVAVGGTTIDDATARPPLEHVWNDGAVWGAGGGGISESWAMPAWQRESRVPGIALPGSADYTNADSVEQSFGYKPNFCQSHVTGATSSTPCRLVPDVSAQGDQFTGAITIYQAAVGGWQTIGGTSSSAPLWAAMLALTNESSACKANPATQAGVGFVSPLLYEVASNPGQYAVSFNDVTAGNNDIYDLANGTVFPATTGYDLSTGLGSPQLTGVGGTAGLSYYLCSYAAAASRPVVSGLSPSSGTTAGGEKVKISGTGFEANGVSKVASIQVGTATLPAGDFTVNSATSITATLPPASETVPPTAPAPQDGAGPVEMVVVLRGGQASRPSSKSTFEYVDTSAATTIPSVTGVVPVGGSESSPGTVTILGSGFTGATKVTFGGVRATSFTVDSRYRITVTPPLYSPKTHCAPLPSTGVYAGENATNDICQVQARVFNANGESAPGRIRPPLEGAVTVDSLGALVAPPGCGCETTQGATEFDYIPTPTITSVSTHGAANLASENGVTVITVKGTGLNPMTILWADFGDPARADSMDTSFVFVTGTEMQIVAAGEPVTVDPAHIPLSVKTLAGQSAPMNVTYAGIPNVTAVINTINSTSLSGTYGGPDTGRTPIEIDGKGFSGQLIAPVVFTDIATPFSTGTQYTFTVQSNTKVTTETPSQNPAVVDVEVCTATDCSLNPPADLFILYPPGDPKVTSVKPASGPAAGGTQVAIGGANLGCPVDVFFGTVEAETFAPAATGLDCGSTSLLQATSPAGTAGTSVPVTVTTAESYFTGSGRSASTANFTYK